MVRFRSRVKEDWSLALYLLLHIGFFFSVSLIHMFVLVIWELF